MNARLKLEDFADSTFDPFAKIAQDHGVEDVADPYPRLAELRKQATVHASGLRDLFGLTNFYGNTGAPCFTVLGYDEVSQSLNDPVNFSNAILRRVYRNGFGNSFQAMDGELHTKYRRLFTKAFLPTVIARWGDVDVPQVVDRLMKHIEGRGRTDLVNEFAALYPFHFMYAQFGLPDDEVEMFHKVSTALICFVDQEHMREAQTKLGTYFGALLEKRRSKPGTDIVSVLATAEVDGERIPDDVLISFLRQLIFAAGDTTYRTTSVLLVGLLQNPNQFDALRRDRKLLPRAIEEALRWDCPATSIPRVATRDVVLGGVPIPAGGEVEIVFASANRDEKVFENPDKFDIFRKPQRHFAFGFGPHICIGQHLARLEVTRAMEAILDRLPNLRLDPDYPQPTITGLSLRAPERLHVLFD